MGYILFTSSSNSRFRITARSACWNGIIEYSYDNHIWQEWHGETIVNNNIYMRGINNTLISYCNPWHISGNNIKCQGNIENLLDYKSVINNVHPKMISNCFSSMFRNCNALIETPQLPSTELSPYCYSYMFSECSNLVTPPKLFATSLSIGCYQGMFCGCTSLKQTPLLMANTIEERSCCSMFFDCNSLTNASNVFAKQLHKYSYWNMFCGCTSLITSPCFSDLPIAKKAIINQQMLEDCPIQFININNKLYDINVLKLL